MTESAIDSRSGGIHFFVIIDFNFLFDYVKSVSFITKFSLDVNVQISFY